MMAGRLQLEVFDRGDRGAARVDMTRDEIEEERLQSFEKGYTAGWDDAVAAQEGETARLTAELVQRIGDMGFSYREARAHVIAALEPLLQDMVAKVLPAIARGTLGPAVVEQLMPLAHQAAGAPVEAVMNPATRLLIGPLLEAQGAVPVVLRENLAFTDGRVDLVGSAGERRVDLDRVIAAIADAIQQFFMIETGRERASG